MNRVLQSIYKDILIIYIKYNDIYIIDNNIYIIKALLKFKYYIKNGRKIIHINRDYLNFLFKALRDNKISYVIIQINYGYNKVLEYNSLNNKYKFYYKKGKRIVKNEYKVNKLLDCFRRNNNLDNIKKAIKVIEVGEY